MHERKLHPTFLVLMGVAGCGKTTVGRLLARRLGCAFHDADDHHPPANIAKMRRGMPLADRDRVPWIETLRQLVANHARAGSPAVLACSALKARYRRRLRARRGAVCFVHLVVTSQVAAHRLAQRKGHFFNPALLRDQFKALEPPRNALRLEASLPPHLLAAQLATWWRRGDLLRVGLRPTSTTSLRK